MTLYRTEYTDEDGRKKVVLLPKGDDGIERGIPVGPPSLEELELPKEVEVRLSNELFNRGILTAEDAFRNRSQLVAAIQSALKVDADRVLQAYIGKEFINGTQESAKEQPDPPLPNRRPRRTG